MSDLATLKAQRAELKEKINSGVTRVRSGGDTIEYASPDEMRRALRDLNQEITALEGDSRPSKVCIISSKGL